MSRVERMRDKVRVVIAGRRADRSDEMFSGVRPDGQPSLVECPNCRNPMFPVFTFPKGAPFLNLPKALAGLERVTLDVCPHCTHSLDNYFVRLSGAQRVAVGGYLDDGEAVEHIDLPYASAQVEVVSDRDFDPEGGMIGHQFGGDPSREEERPISACMSCGSGVSFMGCIEYDDSEVPLTENGGSPVALIIGDMDALNLYVCNECPTINYVYAR